MFVESIAVLCCYQSIAVICCYLHSLFCYGVVYFLDFFFKIVFKLHMGCPLNVHPLVPLF